MRKTILGLFLISVFAITAHTQMITLEGYVHEGGNQGYLNSVRIRIIETTTDRLVTNTFTDKKGFYTANLPINKTYVLRAEKEFYQPEETIVIAPASDADQKISANIQMFRTVDTKGNPIFVEKNGNLPTLIAVAESYGIDSKKISPTANPEGVAFSAAFSQDDPYAEVTNATRLVDKNYSETAGREALKYEKMPTAYQSSVKVNEATTPTEPAPNRDIPTSYNTPTENKKITPPDPQFGETLVKSASNLTRTNDILPNYTGYKIEFITAFTELPSSHEIFQRHGNITMERRPNGLFSYLIGDFTSDAVGQKFLEESLLDRYPNAMLIAYKNGKRRQQKRPQKISTKSVPAPPR